MPHYQELLDFIDLRAQASEASCAAPQKQSQLPRKPHSRVNSFAANSEVNSSCVICRTGKHPLYMCTRFKSMSHDDKMQALKVNRMCTNCLGGGHSKVQCKSMQRCKMCQKPHHTLLHIETQNKVARDQHAPQEDIPEGSHAAAKLTSNVLLMTCRVLITAPDGSTIEARALLDNASSASFISERLAHSLSLPRMSQSVSVSGIGGVYHKPPTQSVTRFQLSSLQTSGRKVDVTAVVVPRVTCDLPMKPVAFEMSWMHISDLPLADPGLASQVESMYCSELTYSSMYCVMAGGRVLLAHLQLLRRTLAGYSVVILDQPLQLLRKPMSTSQPFTPQSYPLMTFSGVSGRLKNHPLTKLPSR